MKINPTTYYGPDYWTGEKTYRDHDGTTVRYPNPALQWSGFDSVLDAILYALSTPRPKTWLDLCCGGGDVVRRVRARGIDAKGIDISAYAIENAGPDLADHLVCADILNLPPDRALPQYDVITAFDALEHFYCKDADRVISLAMAHATRAVVFCIGAADRTNEAFFLSPGEVVPPEMEPSVVAGHVTIAPFAWWERVISRVVMSRLGWYIDYRAMTHIQVAFIEDDRFRDHAGRVLQAWGPNRVIVLSHA